MEIQVMDLDALTIVLESLLDGRALLKRQLMLMLAS